MLWKRRYRPGQPILGGRVGVSVSSKRISRILQIRICFVLLNLCWRQHGRVKEKQRKLGQDNTQIHAHTQGCLQSLFFRAKATSRDNSAISGRGSFWQEFKNNLVNFGRQILHLTRVFIFFSSARVRPPAFCKKVKPKDLFCGIEVSYFIVLFHFISSSHLKAIVEAFYSSPSAKEQKK